MRFAYREYDPSNDSREEFLARMRSLYNDLLLQANGDPEQALAWIALLAERYNLFPEGFTVEDLRRALEKERLIEQSVDGLRMAPGAESALRRESLERIFGGLSMDAAGDHRVSAPGVGNERLPETRPWAFGDPASLIDPSASVHNALRRGLGADGSFQTLEEEDLEVYETEHLSSCSTVLLIDISHSMILYGEDRITPAKRVALALTELIRTRYPKDSLSIATFGDEAKQVSLDEISKIGVGPFHTNTRDALRLARDLLRRQKRANKQILMITDGKPSALTERNGEIYKNPIGLDRRVVSKTLDEATLCRRYGIPITTFMLTDDPVLVKFIEDFTEANQGRAYFAGGGRLGATLFVDYMKNRKRSV